MTLIEAMADEKQIATSDFDFGRFEGIWADDKGRCEFEIVIDETNFHAFDNNMAHSIEGFFEWRITKDEDDEYVDCLGRQAMEKIRGFFYEKEKILICLGYELVQNQRKTFLGHDGHYIQFNNNYNNSKTIDTKTLGRELWQIMESYFNEAYITNIVCSYLHKFKIEDNIDNQSNYNAWSFNDKLIAMNKKHNKHIVTETSDCNFNVFDSLFNDLSYKTVKYSHLTMNELSKHFGDNFFVNVMGDELTQFEQMSEILRAHGAMEKFYQDHGVVINNDYDDENNDANDDANNGESENILNENKDNTDWYIIYFAGKAPGLGAGITIESLQEQRQKIDNQLQDEDEEKTKEKENEIKAQKYHLIQWLLWNKFLKKEFINGNNNNKINNNNVLIIQGTPTTVISALKFVYTNLKIKFIPFGLITKNGKIEAQFHGPNWFNDLTQYWNTYKK